MLCTAFWLLTLIWGEKSVDNKRATSLASYFRLASPECCAAGLGSGSGPGATMRSCKEVPAGHLAGDSWKIWSKRPCKSARGDPASHWYVVPKSQLRCGVESCGYPGDAHMLESSLLCDVIISPSTSADHEACLSCLNLPKSPSPGGCSLLHSAQCLELLGSWSVSNPLHFPRLHIIGFVVSLRSSGSLDRNSFTDQLSSFSVVHFNSHSSAF